MVAGVRMGSPSNSGLIISLDLGTVALGIERGPI